jgi:hypothetical protein
LPVYGPVGVEKVADGFEKAYELDSDYRTEHHKPFLDQNKHGLTSRTIPYPNEKDGNVLVFDDSNTNATNSMQIFAFEGLDFYLFQYISGC